MRKRNFGLAPIIIIVLIALIGAGAYFLGTKNILKLTASLPLPFISPSPTSATANWIIYTGDSFSFSYPKDFQYIKYENGVVGFFDNTDTYQACLKYIQQKTKNLDSPCFQNKFNFNGFRTLSQNEYQNFLNSRIDPKEYIDSQSRKWQTDWIEAEAYNFEAITNLDGKYYSVFFQGNKISLSDRSFFDQILSTFKFTNGSVYSNAEYKFSFEIKNGERVVECPNKSEFSDNTAVWVSKTPQPQNPQSDCATEGPENSVFASKKAYGLSSVDDYIKSLESPGNDYQLVKVSITVSGIKGLKITGTRDPNKPAPLPSEIKKIVLSNEGILYIFDPSFLERNFSITK